MYIDQDTAPPSTKRFPRESAREKADEDAPAAAAPPPELAPTVRTTSPRSATMQADQTFLPMDCLPIKVERSGVNKTLVCVRKAARADPVVTNPTFSIPCDKNPHTASSIPDRNSGSLGEGGGRPSLLCLAFWLPRKSDGRNYKNASHPLVAESAAAVGGISGTS